MKFMNEFAELYQIQKKKKKKNKKQFLCGVVKHFRIINSVNGCIINNYAYELCQFELCVVNCLCVANSKIHSKFDFDFLIDLIKYWRVALGDIENFAKFLGILNKFLQMPIAMK